MYRPNIHKANPCGMTGFPKEKILPQPFRAARKRPVLEIDIGAGEPKLTPAEPLCSRQLWINTFAVFG
jgi:hypothetical protein